uniref:Uncharacterized protein n=1 Tax=Eutreptiella gymnastica TaxID=73025 RepID=A0A7S1J2L2_9EUGL
MHPCNHILICAANFFRSICQKVSRWLSGSECGKSPKAWGCTLRKCLQNCHSSLVALEMDPFLFWSAYTTGPQMGQNRHTQGSRYTIVMFLEGGFVVSVSQHPKCNPKLAIKGVWTAQLTCL